MDGIAGPASIFRWATALKAYPWTLAVYLACRRKWSALRWMIVGGAMLSALTTWSMGPATVLSFVDTWSFTNRRQFLANPDNLSINGFVSRLFWFQGNPSLSHRINNSPSEAVIIAEVAVLVLTAAATARAEPDRGWRALSLWMVAMVLPAPIAHGHYLVLMAVPFAAIAEAARQRDADPVVIYCAIASYLLSFSNYPLSLLQHYHWIGGASFRIASEYGFAAVIFAYLATCCFACGKPRAVVAFSHGFMI
jgi:Glycosyltransferase family 87